NHFQQVGFDLNHPRVRKYWELCERIQDLPRHLGQHSGGMVICQGQLDSVVPLEPASMPGRVVVQWDKDDCADMRIIKVDLLGLGMMAVLEHSIEIIREDYGEEVDLPHLPPDDPAVYSTLQKADTIGMFQIEGRAQMSCLPRLRPQRFYDIVVQVAIIRPGPIVGQMVNPFLQRRQGREPVTYPHPALEPVLARTLGVPLFQEQLLRMAMIAAGFTGGEAEELRRAMGFKRSQARMKEIEAKLRYGMTKNGIAPEAQEQIILSITSFALYGFPESHAASFALLAYASAYLKCHYLAAFTAALLNNQPMGFYHPATIVKDAQRHGLKVLPIDVMKSDWLCTLEPVSSFKFQVSSNSPESSLVIPSETGCPLSGQPVKSRDLLFTDNRPKLTLRLGLRYVRGLREEAGRALVRDSGPMLEELPEPDSKSPLHPMNEEERLVADFRGTGLTVGPHPMAYRRAQMERLGICRASELSRIPDGERLRVAGCVIVRQRPGTAKGFVFLSLEDETGIANAIITPGMFQRNRLLLVREKFVMIEGILQHQDNVISVKADRILPLDITQAETNSHDFH